MIEESGTACGLDWRDDDSSFFKALLWINLFLTVIAMVALRAAFSQGGAITEAGQQEEEWFTEKQLNWVCTAVIKLHDIACVVPSTYLAKNVLLER